MVNKTLFGTFGVGFVALILMLTAFIVGQWQSKVVSSAERSNGQVDITQYQVGLSTFVFEFRTEDSSGTVQSSRRFQGALATDTELEYTTVDGRASSTSTVSPPTSTDLITASGLTALINDSRKARDSVLGTGIPAFIIGVVVLGMLLAIYFGKGTFAWFRSVTVLLCVLTAVMTFLGVFLYAEVLDIGYSFILWAGFAIFALLGGIFVIIASQGSKSRWASIACILIALIFGVVGLATTAWYAEVEDRRPSGSVTTANAGVKMYSVLEDTYASDGTTLQTSYLLTSTFGSDTFDRTFTTSSSSSSLTITKCSDILQECYRATFYEKGRFKDFIPAGQQALGCGIPALAFGVAALVAMGVLLTGNPHKYAKMAAIAFAFVCSGLAFLGLFLYAAITSVGSSFVVYSAAGFMWALAASMAFGLLSEGGGAATSKPTATA